jgi:uncharacterized small protein (DUF1192 family)
MLHPAAHCGKKSADGGREDHVQRDVLLVDEVWGHLGELGWQQVFLKLSVVEEAEERINNPTQEINRPSAASSKSIDNLCCRLALIRAS